MSFSLDLFSCFQGVVDQTCADTVIDIGNVSQTTYTAQAKKFSGEATTFFALGLKFFLITVSGELTTNQIKGINAAKCSAVALLDESW